MWWHKGLSLAERQALIAIPERNGDFEQVVAAGRQRLERWQERRVLAEASLLAQRLAAAGLSQEAFLYLLGAPAALAGAALAESPAWAVRLERIYREARETAFPEEVLKQEPRLNLFGPIIADAGERFDAGVRELAAALPCLPFAPERVRETMQPLLAGRLAQLAARTLVLQVNIERLLGQLQGDTPGERYQNFLDSLRRPARAFALLQEYPVLARLALTAADNWVSTSLEFLEHLGGDWTRVKEFCGERDPGLLERFQGGAGDTHRGGRTVAIVEFSSGFKIVYKPRPMAVDAHFQATLAWLNAQGARPPFRVLQVADRGDHGWMEFVTAAPCETAAERQRFYRRLGGFIALLFAMEATDFHHENLIAAGEQPVLVDLESIFQPRTFRHDVEQDPRAPMRRLLEHSVARLGILPHRAWRTKQAAEGVDISGMASPAGQMSPFAAPVLEYEATDRVRFVKRRREMEGSHNTPVADPADLDLPAFAGDVVAGFQDIYRLLQAKGESLLAPGGALAAFAGDQVRVIMRPTFQYALLLRDGGHPHMLRDALERDLLMDELWRLVAEQPQYAAIVAAEQADLRQGDIPVFNMITGERDLLTSASERLPAFFAESGQAAVGRRLSTFGDEELGKQTWFIRAAIASAEIGPEKMARPDVSGDRPPAKMADREALLAGAVGAGDRLAALALREGEAIGWLGVNPITEEHWALDPVGLDLYGGLPGITLFLAYLGHVTGVERYTELARLGVETIRKTVSADPESVAGIGAFQGWGGLVYLYTHLAALWRGGSGKGARGQVAGRARLDEAEALLPRIEAGLAQDRAYDVIAGAAGAILCLKGLLAQRPSAQALALAEACGEHLLAHARPGAQGWGWQGEHFAEPLCGFSHGAAGVAAALFTVSELSRQERLRQRFRAGARQALAYERSLFDAEANNWPDLRMAAENGEHPFMSTWCHGAPGIGLGRLLLLPALEDGAVAGEIAAAVATTRHTLSNNHCLCHGQLGNLETLLAADRMAADLGEGGQTHGSAPTLAAGGGGGQTHGSAPTLPAGGGGGQTHGSAPTLPAGGDGGQTHGSAPTLPAGGDGGQTHGSALTLPAGGDGGQTHGFAPTLPAGGGGGQTHGFSLPAGGEQDSGSGLHGQIRRVAGQVLAEIEAEGWRCGTPLGVETPGLMVGIAGIGYQLLRLANPDMVPSVLALEPPR